MENFDFQSLKGRIKSRLTALDMSARSASIAVSGKEDLLRGLFRGENNTLRGDNLLKLAAVLKVSAQWLMTGHDRQDEGENPSEISGVRFGGIVEAGAFRAVNTDDQSQELERTTIRPDPRYPSDSQFAFRVVGDSMTEARIFDGMHVLAVELQTWQRFHGEPSDGKLVIASRGPTGETNKELTVKRLRLFRDRVELQPESLNPHWKPIVFKSPPEHDEHVVAEIIAVVISAIWIYG
jgi:SOS-response transcriptional repressor LexA